MLLRGGVALSAGESLPDAPPGHEGRPLYALSAFRHLAAGRGGGSGGREGGHGEASPSHVTGHYTVRLEPHDGQVAGASYEPGPWT